MNKEIFRIRPAINEVRTTLSPEDIVVLDVFEQAGLVRKEYIDYPDVYMLVFKNPYRTPSFKRFYASRITGINDPYLPELCKRLLYLNPKPDTLMLKKLAEFIVLRFSKIEMKTSKVKSTVLIPTPVLTFEGVEAVLAAVRMEDYTPDNTDVIMFPREGLTKGEKISARASYRRAGIASKMADLIGQVTEVLIEETDLMKLTHARIEDSKLVHIDGKLAPIRAIRKFMDDRTRRIIKEHNDIAPFKTVGSLEKFLEYVSGVDYSLEQTAARLHVSKSMVVKFRKLKSNYNDNNSI